MHLAFLQPVRQRCQVNIGGQYFESNTNSDEADGIIFICFRDSGTPVRHFLLLVCFNLKRSDATGVQQLKQPSPVADTGLRMRA